MIRAFLALALAVAPPLSAQLLVTEINSNGTPGDFWELTNFGTSAVSLAGYKWNDSLNVPTALETFTLPAGASIAAGESIIFSSTISATDFRTAWNLASSVQVFTGGPGLGQNDRISLYNASNVQVLTFSYAASGFTRSNGLAALGGHAGLSAGGSNAAQSLIFDPNFGSVSPRYTFATGGNFSSSTAAAPNTGIGSPGLIGIAGSNSTPTFALPTTTYWTAGTALTNSGFRVIATDPDAGQSLTLTVLSKPAWLTLSSDGAGRLRLTGTTPTTAGEFTFTVRAADNFATPAASEQTFTLITVPSTAPILLNEYNGVSSTNFLRGGSATADADGVSPGPTDSHFGRVLGNGGEWVEFVVVGNGSANSLTDMRGWRIEIDSANASSTLVLSQHPYWSNVRSGTILTFTLEDTVGGGLDTHIHRTSALHTLGGGFVWTNIHAADPVFISQSASTIPGTLGIGSDDTVFSIHNASGTRISGPAGESVAAFDSDGNFTLDSIYGVSSTEILRAQANPTINFNPISGAQNDASTFSTFGSRNRWGSGGISQQSFAAFATTNAPPQFTSSPPTRQITTSFSYNITTSDPNGHAVTVSAGTLPSFLTFTPGSSGTATLATNRALTLADAGEYTIQLTANDGQSVANTTPQAFVLNVFNTPSPIILNEFNAVAPNEFLNGGNLANDIDGAPAATDSHFGRVQGNGGRWFELVVTGNGSASTLDLRGWSVEIGTSNQGEFLKSNTIVFSNSSTWESVPAGTLLTFTERNSANGGLDTGVLLRNRLSTVGDAWTNVWIGDATLLVQTSPAVNGYTINGGIVENLRISQSNTQFILKNPAGQRVFGPAGEGIGPGSGVSDTEILELEAHPLPTVSPLTVSGVSVYDDASSGSTFGLPNSWQPDIGAPLTQDFSPYQVAPTPYESWAASFSLSGNDALTDADPDLDGRDNFTEYAFGGNPGVIDAPPAATLVRQGSTGTWTFALRDDPAIDLTLQRSTTLAAWSAFTPTVQTAPHPSLASYLLVTVSFTPAPVDGREFLRALATP
ncbi:MAG: lamin tail domain-containing protein [Akkermansiaceae bacterium]|jgi:hypothetical protein|nr:lamin tail domain-containing protein [Akkermansiaceae bacterium]